MALADVKLILGIPATDTSKDSLLQKLLNNANQAIMLYLNTTEVPDSLQWIADEITVARYNRLGAEGINQENIEGVSYSYQDDVFQRFTPFLDLYMKNNSTESNALPKLKMY